MVGGRGEWKAKGGHAQSQAVIITPEARTETGREVGRGSKGRGRGLRGQEVARAGEWDEETKRQVTRGSSDPKVGWGKSW